MTLHLRRGSVAGGVFGEVRRTMTHVAHRIVNDVSSATRKSHASDFSWQAQCLVSLDNDSCCSTYL